MAYKLVTCLNLLKSCVAMQSVRKASELLENICRYFDDDFLTVSEKDLGVHQIFNENSGLLKFLEKTLKANKLFKECNVTVLKLLKKILDDQTKKLNQYTPDIAATMVSYALSSLVTAKEKECAVLILQSLVTHNLCQDINLSQLVIDLVRIFNMKKPTGKFLQLSFELLGMISKEYPEQINDGYDIGIRDLFFNSLEKALLKQEDTSYLTLTGALNGFSHFLVNFAPNSSNEPNTCHRLYVCVKKLSDPTGLNDHTPFRASLNLLSHHISFFAELVFRDNQFWHSILQKWLKLPTWEDRKTAINLSHQFHKELSRQIEERKNPADSAILQFFINYFKATMRSQTAQSYEIRIAIRAFGSMAGPCKILLPADLPDFLTLVIQRTEYLIMQKDYAHKDLLEHYPDFVEALSQIMQHCNELTGVQIQSLQNIVIALIKDFHLLSHAHHTLAIVSLLKTFLNLSRLGGSILDDVLERVIFQGVVWTCSHKLMYDANDDWDTFTNWREHITYHRFKPLWLGLLDDADDVDLVALKGHIYDHCMSTLFDILDKLNLNTKKRVFKDEAGNDQEYYFCDPNYDLVPVNPKDFHIFFNLVDFYCDILHAQSLPSHLAHFSKWIRKFCNFMITKSIKYPLISGFLKLLKVGIRIGIQIKYFDRKDDRNWEQFSETVKYFLKMCMSRAQQTSGELQMAVLQLILNAPIGFLIDFLQDFQMVLVIAFDIGHSMIYLANLALTAMDKITQALATDAKGDFLRALLPNLESYLQSRGNTGRVDVEIVKSRHFNRTKKTFNLGKDSESELLKFQKRILQFLGNLEPNACVYLLSDEQKHENLVKFDFEQNIQLNLHCGELTPVIYLDTLIPRIGKLAVKSSERATKIAACELLHACVLYLLGTNKHQGKIWQELCTKMVLLSCDADVAVQQMFEPLLMQVIHYVSQRSQLQSIGVEILIDCLMDGISHRTNSTVRDMSARSLREFLTWSIRQTTKAQRDASPISIELLLSKLKVYSFDSDKYKRKGSALAFNNLYRLLREEEKCLDLYWLDLFYTFSINFVLTEELTSDLTDDSYEEVSKCLDHIARVLCERRDLFNTSKENRIVPLEFSGQTLKDALLWLLRQCGNRNLNYRRKCTELFKKLAPLAGEYNSVQSFIQRTQTPDQIIEIAEGTREGTGLIARPDLTHLKISQESSILGVYAWLQHFLGALDSYIWLIGDNVAPEPQKILQQSVIFKVIVYYLQKISSQSMMDILTSDSVDDPMENLNLQTDLEVIYKIETIKCHLTDRIFQFLLKMIAPDLFIPKTFWDCTDQLIGLIVNILFAPQNLDIDYLSNPNCNQLAERICSFLATCHPKQTQFSGKLCNRIAHELITRIQKTNKIAEMMLHCDQVPIDELHSIRGILIISQKRNQLKFIASVEQDMIKHAKELLFHLFSGIQEKMFDYWQPVHLRPELGVFAIDLMNICLSFLNHSELVLKLILNSETLTEMNAAQIQHGHHFVETFKKPIFEYILTRAEETIPWLISQINESNINYIVRTLSSFILFVFKYKRHDRQCLQAIVNNFLRQWPTIISKCPAQNDPMTIFTLIEFMTNITLICPYQLKDINNRAAGLSTWILSIISNGSYLLELKSRTIFLLPCLIDQDDLEHVGVQNALEKIQQQYFPIQSAEFKPGSLERSAFENVFKIILDALAASRSPVILKFVINATAADRKHIMEWAIQESLATFMKTQTPFYQAASLAIPFELFANLTLEPTLRLSIVKRFLLNMIPKCSIEAIVQFYTTHIKRISDMADTNYSISGSGWRVEHALVSRIGAFHLIELLFGTIKKEQLQDASCTIGGALFGPSKPPREIIKTCTTKALSARSEIFITDDPSATELFRIYQCAAYTAMCAIISNTQDELKFYHSFLFKENPTKNEYIWQKIINTSDANVYGNFDEEFDVVPKVKERIVSIRRIHEQIAEKKPSAKYLQSQTIFDSSLSQDVTKIDLTLSTIRTADEVATMQTKAQPMAHVALEKLRLNKHEVMPILCAVVKHMYENGITPITEDRAQKSRIAPDWASGIARIIGDCTQPKNIRLFMAKVVDNCREVFRSYARTFYRSILQFLADECAGERINHFNRDLLITLLEWDNIYKIQSFEEYNLASTVLFFFVRNSWHPRKDIFKHHLEMVKLMIEKWSGNIVVPNEFLFNSINRSQRTDSKDNICGIQLNAIFIANDIVPWTQAATQQFLRALFISLDNNFTSVYQPASQLLGMCLRKILPVDENISDDAPDHPCIAELKNKLSNLKTTNEKKFVDIIFGIHKNYPIILDSFLVSISNNIPTSSGAIKRINLEMFLSRMDIYGTEVYRELLVIGITDLLKASEFQLHALHIVNKALPNMSLDDIKSILGDITGQIGDSNRSDCRQIIYEMLMFALEKFPNDAEIRKLIIPTLLIGLSDSDVRIQNRLTQFWSTERNLSNKLDQRILELLSKLYEPESEKYFLSTCAQLLLEPAIQSGEAKKQIFQHQTGDEEFKLKEYNINLNWKVQNSTFKAPLFVESQQKQLFSGSQTIAHSLLQATTSNLAFEPTLDPATMTQTSNNFSLQTQSSLLFGDQPQVLDRRSTRITSARRLSADDDLSLFDRLRKRFLRDKEQMHKKMALNKADEHAYKSVIQLQAKKKKENQVTLYRRYRFGEYPDLQINNLALLLPLKALVRCDKKLARLVFVSIFTATRKELAEMANQFIISASDFMQSIFLRSKYCDPVVFGSLIEIALSDPTKFDLPPDMVAIFSNANNMMAIGILYLENRLMCDWDTGNEPSSKRSTSSSTIVEKHWLKLAEIYRGLAEHDIVAGIFAEKLRMDDKIPRAIEFELNNNYEAAQKIYLEMANQGSDFLKDFAYQSYYNCFMHMGNWSALLETVEQQLDSMDQLWTDPWNMDNLLPHIMRCELRQTLDGESRSRDFLIDLENWIRSEERWEYLKLNFAEELMMFHIANKDFRRAKFHAEEYTTAFIAEWPNLNVLSDKVRCLKLLNIRTVAETQKYSELLLQNDSEDAVAQNLIERWNQSKPDVHDSTILWDTLIAYRSFISALASSNMETNTALGDSVDKMNFALLDVALAQENTKLSDQIIHRLSSCQNDKTNIMSTEWLLARSKHQAMKAKARMPIDALDLYLKAWDRIDVDILPNPLLVKHPQVQFKTLNNVAVLAMSVSELLPKIEHIDDVTKDHLLLLTASCDSDDIQTRLHDYAYHCLENSINLVEPRVGVDNITKETVADAYYNLAEYCQDNLLNKSNKETTILSEAIIRSVLRGMQYGSKKAQRHFPRLLQLPNLNTADLKTLFNAESSLVPEWMFIAWIPQIISMVNFKMECFLDQLLLRIARAYPSAIYYPFQLFLDQNKRDSNNETTDTDETRIRSVIAQVSEIVCNPLAGKFTKALNNLCMPELKLKFLLYGLQVAIVQTPNMSQRAFVKYIKWILAEIFSDDANMCGKVLDRVRMFKGPIENVAQFDLITEKKTILAALKQYIEQLGVKSKLMDGEQSLEKFCPWLYHFQWYGKENWLEIPGQYAGNRKPDSQNHIKMIKFTAQVTIFPTMRRPIKLSIHGSDGKTYDYLIKYGEDLRQDQRIQQIFYIMTDLLANDKQCRSHKLTIGQFNVIPVNDHCGMLSWIPNTISMYEVIEKSADRRGVDVKDKLNAIRVRYREFIRAASSGEQLQNGQPHHEYGMAVVKYSRKDIETNFKSLVMSTPTDIIKSVFIDMCISPESYFALRNNFATSLAAMNISQWVLGIGDRHLANILLCRNTGSLIGIDFGFAFGAGTRNQYIPELVPFRLTPQFINALNPLGLTGLITNNMIYALRTYRQNRKLLMACMEVFIREPTIDWLISAKNKSNLNDLEWDPIARINIARKKLNGGNPKLLMEQDIAEGVISSFPQYAEKYRDLVRSNAPNNKTNQMNVNVDNNLSVEQQVQCLLDLATDPALLGIAYAWFHGWI